MNTLIVTAHPDTGSLTHQASRRLRERLGRGASRTAHLAQEGLDPRFGSKDRQAYLEHGRPAPDVVAEQQRIDGASHLVLVFPVYWWSLPALLKGWVDRVFIGGWAFEDDTDGKVVPKLQRVTAHLLPISGTGPGTWARHAYAGAFRAQVEHGIIDFCGVQRGVTCFVYDAESGDGDVVDAAVDSAVATIASAITALPAQISRTAG